MDNVQLEENVYFPLHRQHSCLHNRLAFTYSDCSSSLSSLSVGIRQQQQQSEIQNLNNTSRMTCAAYWISISIIIALSAGICSVYGIFQQRYMQQLASFEADSFSKFHYFGFTFVGALQLACFMTFQRVPSIVKKPIGIHTTMLIGTMTIGGGLLAAEFSNQLWQLWLSQGVLVGSGAALCLMSAIEVLKTQQLLGESGPIVSIIGIGGCVLAIITWQLTAHGQETNRALGWLALIVCGGQLVAEAALFIISRHKHKYRVSISSWTPQTHVSTSDISSQRQYGDSAAKNSLRKPHIVLALVSIFCFYLSAPAPFLFITSFACEQMDNASFDWGVALLAVLCFASAIGGITIPHALRKQLLSHSAKLGLMQICLSLSVWCFWLPDSGSLTMLLVFCITYGLFFGSASQLVSTGNHHLCVSKPQTFSWMWTLCSITGTFIGICVDGILLAGWIYSGTFSYAPLVTFIASAGLAAAAASAMSAFTSPPLDYKHIIARLKRTPR